MPILETVALLLGVISVMLIAGVFAGGAFFSKKTGTLGGLAILVTSFSACLCTGSVVVRIVMILAILAGALITLMAQGGE